MLGLRIVPAALAALLPLLCASTGSAASCAGAPPAICPLGAVSGNDCRIGADCTIDSSAPTEAILQFGTRRPVIGSGAKVTVLGDGILDISAGGGFTEAGAKVPAAGAAQCER